MKCLHFSGAQSCPPEKWGQSGQSDQMIWSVAEQIAKLSEANELFPGDIIYSGTPENVGPVVRGDIVRCMLSGFPDLVIKIV